jgi:shikimate kinase
VRSGRVERGGGYLVLMPSDRNLVLTGFMGTGKTTVGRELARKLDMEFVDTDELIESRHGPIAGIFEQGGEAEFRSMEQAIALELGAKSGLVIATGGKMILDPENFRSLSRNGDVFCLVATPDEIYRRIINEEPAKQRPMLAGDNLKGRILELMEERGGEYERFRQVNTDQLEPGEIADEIVRLRSDHQT